MKAVFFSAIEEEKELISEELSGFGVSFVDDGVNEESIRDVLDAEVISCFVKSELPKEILEQFKNLKFIATRSTGFDHIDLDYAREHGIVASNIPEYGSRTVAEFTMALMLALSRKAYEAYDELRTTGERDVSEFEGFDLYGKTLGVIGTGNIGKNVIKIARGFGMDVIAFDVSPDKAFAKEEGFIYASMDDVFKQSDVVTLHVPLLESTHHMISDEAFNKMEDGVILINTARGELIDTAALLSALKSGRVGAAGLDVLEGERELNDELELLTTEPHDVKQIKILLADHELLDLPNVIVTPHIAFNTREAKKEILRVTIKNIKQFKAGNPINVVS